MKENQRLDREIEYTQWGNWVMLKEYLKEDIDTGDNRDASWEWTIDNVWIRVD